MLLFGPLMAVLLAQTVVTAPAPAPSPMPLPSANNPPFRHVLRGLGSYVKRLVGISPREEVKNFGDYGSYGKYGSYGSYSDVGGKVSGEASNEVDAENDAETETKPITTLTTTIPVLTTTITLSYISTPSPTITAVSTDSHL